MDTCSFCRGPFHIATGDLVWDGRGKSYPLCGICVDGRKRHFKKKEISGGYDDGLKKWLTVHLAREWGGGPFYAHATVPPPAVEERYEFTLLNPVPGTTSTFTRFIVEESGVTFQEAAIRLKSRYPEMFVPSEHLRGLWRKKEA